MTHKEEIHERIGVLKGLRVWWWASAAMLFGSAVVAFIVGAWVQGVCGLLWAGTSLLNLKSNSETIKDYEFGLDCTKEDLEHVSEIQKSIQVFNDKIRSCGIRISSGMGPDDDTEKRAVRYYEDIDEIPTNQQ